MSQSTVIDRYWRRPEISIFPTIFMITRSKTSQSANATETRRTLNHSTNRREFIRHFANYLNDDPAKEKIIFFHGDGGNGKTLLLQFLKEKCCRRLHPDNWAYVKGLEGDDFVEKFARATDYAEVPSTLVDFGLQPRGEYRPKDAFYALLKMRRDLSECGIRFPFYDFACVLYLHKTNSLSPETLNSLFPRNGIDLIRDIVEVVSNAPRAVLAKSLLDLFNGRLHDWFTLYSQHRKINEEQVKNLESLHPEFHLYRMFPALFAEDLSTAIAIQGFPQRVALFFDTHEAFWNAFERKFSNENNFIRDEWLRRLLCHLQLSRGIVAVVAGREEPRWAEATKETIQASHIDNCLVGGLSSADAATYLEEEGINDQKMKEGLLSYAQLESGEIHPLYLGLCADVVFNANNSSTEITDKEFRGVSTIDRKGEDLMNRLRKYVDRSTKYAIDALSACRSFDWGLYVNLMERLGLRFSKGTFDYLIKHSFVWVMEGRGKGRYRIHDLIRSLACQQNWATTFEAHKLLAEYYQKMGEQGDITAIAEGIYHLHKFDPANGIQMWIDQMEQALSSGRYDLCRTLAGILNEISTYNDFQRGHLSISEGNYYALMSMHENAQIEYREAVESFNEELRRTPDDVFVYYGKGVALQRLSELQAHLARHRDALDSYRGAITAFDEVLQRAPGDVPVYNNKGVTLLRLGELQANLSWHEDALDSYRRAVASCDDALGYAPDDMFTHNNKGGSLRRLGEVQAYLARHEDALDSYRQAIASYDEAQRVAPCYMSNYYNKGMALQRLGELQTHLAQHDDALDSYQQATASYDEALRLKPDDVSVYYNKGVTLQCLGGLQSSLGQHENAEESYHQAIAALDEVLQRAPYNVNAHNNKGNVLRSLGELQSLHDVIDHAFSRNAHHDGS